MASATKVGAFVVAFVVLLAAAFALLRKSVFEPPVDRYVAEFADAGGLSTGAGVLLAGVVVGSVESVELAGSDKARVGLALRRGVQLPVGTEALLPASFISIGDQRLSLVPPPEAAGVLPPGSAIRGRRGSALEGLAPEGGKLIERMNATLVAVQRLLEDEALRGGTARLLASAKETSDAFAKLATTLDGAVDRNSGQVASLLRTTSATLRNVQALSEEALRVVASGRFEGRALDLLDSLDATVERGQALIAELQGLAADPEIRRSLQGTLENVKVMTDSGVRASSDFETIARNGVEASEETVALLRKAYKLAEDVERLIERFDRTVGGLSERGKDLAGGVRVEAGLARESNPGRFRTDVDATIPLGPQKLTLGLYDAFESNRLNAQLHRDLGPTLGLRYGAYASKPSLGVDFQSTSRIGLRTDLYGINEPKFDVRLRYDFGGWASAWAGVEDLLGRNKPAAGVSVRR